MFSLSFVIQNYRSRIAAAQSTADLYKLVAVIAETFEKPVPTRSWDEEGHQFVGSDNHLERQYASLMLCAAERWDAVA